MSAPPNGIIDANQAYSLPVFRRLAGLGDVAWRNVRDRLAVVEIGRKRYVRGEAWLALLKEIEAEQSGGQDE